MVDLRPKGSFRGALLSTGWGMGDRCCNQKSHFWFPPPLQCCAALVMDHANDTAQGLEVRTWFCQDDRHHTLRRDFGKFDEKRFNEPYWHVEWDEGRQNSFSVQNQVNRSGLVYTVMICDVLGNVGDFDDAWDGTNTGANNLCAQSNLKFVDVLTDSDSEVSSSLRTRRIAAWSSIMITSRFPQLSWRKHLHGWHHVRVAVVRWWQPSSRFLPVG